MFASIKLILQYMKEHKKEILWFKIIVFITLNVFLYSLLYTFLNEPMFWEKHAIKGRWLDTLVSSILYYTDITGIPINKLKIIILYAIIIIINLSFLYFNMMLFAGILIYFARTGYKIYTNYLINNENITWMNLNFEYILTLDEKKQLFLNELIKNNIKIDNNSLNNIIPILDNLKTKNEILLYSKNYMNEYLLALKSISNTSILEQTTSWINPTTIIIGIIVIMSICYGIWYINKNDTLWGNQNEINRNINNSIQEINKNSTDIQKRTIESIQKINNDNKDLLLKINKNEKLIIQSQEESMKAIENHNNILNELAVQNKTIASEFLNVAQETANDPQKFKILSVGLSKSMECVNVLSDKIVLLEDIIDKLQVKVTEIDSRRSFNLVRSLASPRNTSTTSSSNTNNSTNVIKNDENTEI